MPVTSMESLSLLSLGLCLLWWGCTTPGFCTPRVFCTSPVFPEGSRHSSLLGAVGAPPDRALLSSSSRCRAPSPVWPSSRSSRERPPGAAAAPPAGARPEPGAPRSRRCSGPAQPRTRGRLPTDSVMFSSFAAVHPPPDTLFSWVFQLFFPYFSSIASRLGSPGFSLEPGPGLRPCLPPWQPAERVPRVSPGGVIPPRGCLLQGSGARCARPEPPGPVWNCTGRRWSRELH